MVVDEREIRADDGLAVRELDDLNQNFLGSQTVSGKEKCRSYKEWPQVQGFSDLNRVDAKPRTGSRST
jgi:hypothetical protein